jgi:hypothetical protein
MLPNTSIMRARTSACLSSGATPGGMSITCQRTQALSTPTVTRARRGVEAGGIASSAATSASGASGCVMRVHRSAHRLAAARQRQPVRTDFQLQRVRRQK